MFPAFGGSSGVSNVVIRRPCCHQKADLIGGRGSYKFGDQGDKVTVSIEDHARLENVKRYWWTKRRRGKCNG